MKQPGNRYGLRRVPGIYRKKGMEPDGRLTVEAALVLPLFLMVMVSLLTMFPAMWFQLRLQQAMDHAVMSAAAYHAVAREVSEGRADAESAESAGTDMSLLQAGITDLYLRAAIVTELGESLFRLSPVRGGAAGLTLLQSSLPNEDGEIDLVVTYQMEFPFLPGRAGLIRCSQRSICRIWGGTPRAEKPEEPAENDPVVYVTDFGKRYHTDRTCGFLSPKTQAVYKTQVEALRNSAGARYEACDRCRGDMAELIVYITETGDRYHASLECPTFARYIHAVHLSETGGKKLCSRCAKKGK